MITLLTSSHKMIIYALATIILMIFVDEKYGKKKRFRRHSIPYLPDKTVITIMLILLLPMWAFLMMDTFVLKTYLEDVFTVLVHITIYYCVLIIMLPLLRKTINARVIAMFWGIPYIMFLLARHSFDDLTPWLIIKLPKNIMYTFFIVLAIGFVIVMGWKIISHILYKKQVLNGAEIIEDEHILEMWNKEIKDVNIAFSDQHLVKSPFVETPLSIGLIQGSMYIVLPMKNYSDDDLTLIFKHELAHIAKGDVWIKFFVTFCSALCWFNPFMWIASRKCMEDIELSCDEEVLLNADEYTKQKYARLILDTVQTNRGFTTCLSASAQTLRYRLSQIMTQKHRKSGAILIGIVTYLR